MLRGVTLREPVKEMLVACLGLVHRRYKRFDFNSPFTDAL